jgi:hypothetical protein
MNKTKAANNGFQSNETANSKLALVAKHTKANGCWALLCRDSGILYTRSAAESFRRARRDNAVVALPACSAEAGDPYMRFASR